MVSSSNLEKSKLYFIKDFNFPFPTSIYSKGAARFLTVFKKDGSRTTQSATPLNLVRNSRHQIHTLLQRFPVTNRERQDLQPRTERTQYNEGNDCLE